MIYEPPRSVSKRPGYPSGQWHPEPELSQGFGKRLMYLWHQRQMRFWCIVLLFAVFTSLAMMTSEIFAPASFGAGDNGNLGWSITFALATGAALYILVRSGRAVEGLIVAVSDDGIDRLYTAYYEDGPGAYELDFTAKCKSPAGHLQSGEGITLILGRTPILGPQRLLILPRAYRQSTPD
jgi:hypothetical protein